MIPQEGEYELSVIKHPHIDDMHCPMITWEKKEAVLGYG